MFFKYFYVEAIAILQEVLTYAIHPKDKGSGEQGNIEEVGEAYNLSRNEFNEILGRSAPQNLALEYKPLAIANLEKWEKSRGKKRRETNLSKKSPGDRARIGRWH